jgi:murein DD-endopeptidase MepM/ murein hydrolase activator NlpD
MRGVLALLLAAALLGGCAIAAASGATGPGHTVAGASVVTGTTGVAGHVTAGPHHRSAHTTTGQVTLTGVSVASGAAAASASPGAAGAHAYADARSVDLLGGRITASEVERTVDASPGDDAYAGQVTGLVIDGQAIGKVRHAKTYPLADGSGKVVVNHGETGLRLVLTSGTDIHVAVARASAVAAPTPTPTPTSTPEPTPAPTRTARPTATAKPKPTATPKPKPKAPSTAPPKRLLHGSFTFPIFGQASVADNYGAVRAAPIVTHQGDDIFAAFGSPVVAVADGRLSLVGTLPISGNRLWLTDDRGDAFFYAHLSAFSPAAVPGARVKQGTILGYVGNTGDAETTPPHLHFEVHPGGEPKPSVNPYPVLMAWQHGRQVPDTSERPGALVTVRDFIAG